MMLYSNIVTPHRLAQILGHKDSEMVHRVYGKFLQKDKIDFDLDMDLYKV